MNHLKQDWLRRSFIILMVSLVVSALLYTLSLSDWAASMGAAEAREHGERPNAPAIFMVLMPFVKVTMLTLVPALACYLIQRLVGGIKRLTT